jgi:replication factor A1
MTLVDASGPIRATVFQEGVDKYYDMLVEGNVYTFSKGQVKNANKKFSSVNCPYELSFDKDTEILQVRMNDPSTQAFPQKVFNFVPLVTIRTKEVGSTLDILGVVTGIAEASSFTSKNGNHLTKRNITVADSTAQLDLVVWDQVAALWEVQVGTVIGVKNVKLGEFQGEQTLSMGQGSSLEIEPQITDAHKLSSWYSSMDPSNLNVPNLSKNEGRVSSGPTHRETFDDIARNELGKGEKPDYLNVRLTITFIKTESLFYEACHKCNKKVTPYGVDNAAWRCEKCDTVISAVDPRYLVNMMVSDGVTQHWVTAFNDQSIKLFGMSAAEMKLKNQQDPNFISSVCNALMYSQFVGNIRVKEEKFGEANDQRLKLSLSNPIRWIGKAVQQDGVISTYPTECGLMVKDIEAYYA